jgi:hypothetical protein
MKIAATAVLAFAATAAQLRTRYLRAYTYR